MGVCMVLGGGSGGIGIGRGKTRGCENYRRVNGV